MKNTRHQWRCKPVPDTLEFCVLCRFERMCCAYDHDLRGHLCVEDYELARQAEEVLTLAHLEQPTDSILDNPL